MLLLFFAFFLPGFLFPQAPQQLGPFMVQSALVAIPQVLLLLYLLWLRRANQGNSQAWGRAGALAEAWREYGVTAPRASDLVHALAIFAGLVGVLALTAVVLRLIPAGPRRLLEEGFRFRLERPALLPLAVVFALTTAYREELFFRCYLITRLRQLALPPWAAAALSTILFAAGHLYQGLSGFIVATVLGVCFALLFLRLRNLHRLAIAHALYNLAVLGATLLMGEAGQRAAADFFTIGVFSGIVGL
jgi:membrane protease YdiL (CAAX protease family)